MASSIVKNNAIEDEVLAPVSLTIPNISGMKLSDNNPANFDGQLIYVDFDGANNVTYNNTALNINIDNIDVANSGLDQTRINKIITELNTTYAGSGVYFTIAPDSSLLTPNSSLALSGSSLASTIYVGGTGSAFAQYGNFLGLSETIDTGNKISNDEAFVFADKINSDTAITEIIAHEAGHLIGYSHVDNEIQNTISSFANSYTVSEWLTDEYVDSYSFEMQDGNIAFYNYIIPYKQVSWFSNLYIPKGIGNAFYGTGEYILLNGSLSAAVVDLIIDRGVIIPAALRDFITGDPSNKISSTLFDYNGRVALYEDAIKLIASESDTTLSNMEGTLNSLGFISNSATSPVFELISSMSEYAERYYGSAAKSAIYANEIKPAEKFIEFTKQAKALGKTANGITACLDALNLVDSLHEFTVYFSIYLSVQTQMVMNTLDALEKINMEDAAYLQAINRVRSSFDETTNQTAWTAFLQALDDKAVEIADGGVSLVTSILSLRGMLTGPAGVIVAGAKFVLDCEKKMGGKWENIRRATLAASIYKQSKNYNIGNDNITDYVAGRTQAAYFYFMNEVFSDGDFQEWWLKPLYGDNSLMQPPKDIYDQIIAEIEAEKASWSAGDISGEVSASEDNQVMTVALDQISWSTYCGDFFTVSGRVNADAEMLIAILNGADRVQVMSDGRELGWGNLNANGTFCINAIAPEIAGQRDISVEVLYYDQKAVAEGSLVINTDAEGYDLEINTFDVSSRVSPGNDISISINIRNIGEYIASGSVQLSLYAPNGSKVDEEIISVNNISPGLESGSYHISLTPGNIEGIYSVQATLVSNQGDLDISNNNASRAVRVGESNVLDGYKATCYYVNTSMVYHKDNVKDEYVYDPIPVGDYYIWVYGINESSFVYEVSFDSDFPPTDLIEDRDSLSRDEFKIIDGGNLVIWFQGWHGETMGASIQIGTSSSSSSIDASPGNITVYRGEVAEFILSAEENLKNADAVHKWSGSTIDEYDSSKTSGNDILYSVDTSSLGAGNYNWFVRVNGDDNYYFQKLTMTIEEHDVAATALAIPDAAISGVPVMIEVDVNNRSSRSELTSLNYEISGPNGYFFQSTYSVKSISSTGSKVILDDWITNGLDAGTYTIEVNVECGNDVNPSNNTLTKTIEILPEKSLTATISFAENNYKHYDIINIIATVSDGEDNSCIENAYIDITIHKPDGGEYHPILFWDNEDQQFEGSFVASLFGEYKLSAVVSAPGYGKFIPAETATVVNNTAPEVKISSKSFYDNKILQPVEQTFTWQGIDAGSNSEHLKYSWRIDDGDWSELSAGTTAMLSDLKPGNHSFSVKSFDGELESLVDTINFTTSSLLITLDDKILLENQFNSRAGYWGVVAQNSSVKKILSIKNISQSVVDISSISIPDGFSFSTLVPDSLSAGESISVELIPDTSESSILHGAIEFNLEEGVYSSELHVRVNCAPDVLEHELFMRENSTAIIKQWDLYSSDDFTKSDNIYYILNGLDSGLTIKLDGVVIQNGEIFSQAQVNKGLVSISTGDIQFDQLNASLTIIDSDASTRNIQLEVNKYSTPEGLTTQTGTEFGKKIAMTDDWLVIGKTAPVDFYISDVYKKINGSWVYHSSLQVATNLQASPDVVAIKNNCIALGLSNFEPGSVDFGAVFTFKLDGDKWVSTGQLSPTLYEDSDFGYDLDFSESGNYMIISAYEDDNDLGAVYLYELKNGTWNLSKKITDYRKSFLDYGTSVAISDNYAAIGIPDYERTFTEFDGDKDNVSSGAVLLYYRENLTWNKVSLLTSPDIVQNGEGYEFGGNVYIHEKQLFVSDPDATHFGRDSGGVFVYDLTDGKAIFKQKIEVPFNNVINVGYSQLAAYDNKILVSSDNNQVLLFVRDESNLWHYKATILLPVQYGGLIGDSFDLNENEAIFHVAQANADTVISVNLETLPSANHFESQFIRLTENAMNEICVPVIKNGVGELTYKSILVTNIPDNFLLECRGNIIGIGDVISLDDIAGGNSLSINVSTLSSIESRGAFEYSYQVSDFIYTAGGSIYLASNYDSSFLIPFDSDSQPSTVGRSTDLSNDWAVIGSPYSVGKAYDSGKAYIYKRTQDGWESHSIICASEGHTKDQFGISVATSGDRIVVGAIEDADQSEYGGSAYIYEYDGNSWIEKQKLYPTTGADTSFGVDVDICGDYIIVGTIENIYGYVENNNDQGSAYIYAYNGSSWVQQAYLQPTSIKNDRAGDAVAITQDYAFVGAKGRDDKGNSSGIIWVYHRNGTTWQQTQTIYGPDTQASDEFGRDISVVGNIMVTGTYYNNKTSRTNSGSAYIFELVSNQWVYQTTLTSGNFNINDRFGTWVSTDGEHVYVSAPGEGETGTVYKYSKKNGLWTLSDEIRPESGNIGLGLSATDKFILTGSGFSSYSDTTLPTFPRNFTCETTGKNILLDWTDSTDDSSGVKEYTIQYSDNATFTGASSLTSVASELELHDLGDGTYFWRVRAEDNVGNFSAWTRGGNFTIDITDPNTPGNLTAHIIAGNNVALDWSDATDATSGVKQYEYQIDNNSDLASAEKSGVVSDSITNVSSIANGNYFWRVRTEDNAGNFSEWITGSNFIIEMPFISLVAADDSAGEPGDNGTFRITRTGDITSALTVYFTMDGIATSGSDYTLKNGGTALTDSVVIAAGHSYVDVTLQIINNAFPEGTESATLTLTANNTYLFGSTTSGTINITDDDKFTPIVTSQTVTSEEIVSGTQSVRDAGITNNATINSLGRQNISSGGVANSTTVNKGGQVISFGGIANSAIINSGTWQGVSSGGVANNTVLNTGWQYLYTGGVASSTTVNSLGNQILSSGGTASGTIVNTNGKQIVSSGGKANVTTINTLGSQNIVAGGIASGTMVNANGKMYISSGGVANTATINVYGSQNIYASGMANATLVNGGGQYVSGGTANATTVSKGNQVIYSGGIATGTLINSGAWQGVSSGGAANNTMLNNYGWQYVYGGGLASATTVNNGYQIISSGGAASGTIVNTNGKQIVSSGGKANVTTINTLGSQNIVAGGIASGTMVNANGKMYVSSGGVANAATINVYGSQNIYAGGIASATLVNGGGQYVSGGTANATTVSKGNQVIYSGGIATGTLINSGAWQGVSYGGVANNTMLNNYGWQYVYGGGLASATTVNNGYQIISSGGAASGTIVNTNGKQIVSSGGKANVTTINTLGSQNIVAGGIASGTMVNANGKMYISSGGVANTATINVYGSQNIYASGMANATLVNGGGQYVSGGTANATTVSKGNQVIYSGGIATGTLINSGAWQGVSSGGAANNTMLNNYGWQYVYGGGLASATTVNNGYQIISSGAIASGTILNTNGKQIVSSGGVANATTVNASGNQNIVAGGIANGTMVNANGKMYVSSGGVANAATINVYGSQNIYAGGIASATLVNGGGQHVSGGTANATTVSKGSQVIYSGGIATGTLINSGAWQGVSYGGVANNTMLNNYGWQYLFTGGVASATTVNSAGYQILSSGGNAKTTTVNSGGYQNIYTGGVASGTIVNFSGKQFIYAGGTANSATINSGGSLFVSSGGILSGSLTINGGHATVAFGDNIQTPTVSFSLATAHVNDALLVIQTGLVGNISGSTFNLNIDNTATGSYILADGANLTSISSVTFSVTDNGQNVSMQVGTSYTFADGDHLSLSFSDSTRDKLIAAFTNNPPAAPQPIVFNLNAEMAAASTFDNAKIVDSVQQTGWVTLAGNDDDYRFDLASPVTGGTLRLHDLTGGNADLSLYNALGTLLQSSNNTGTLDDSIISNLAAGTYFARVNAVSGNIDYKLDFDKKYVTGMLAS